MTPVLYNFSIRLYRLAILIAYPFNAKARLWVKGRKGIFKRLREVMNPDDRIIWFHVASLGEFEQGRPLMEALHKNSPEYKILLTFFSPSGYEVRKNHEGADFVFYLPLDTPRNARRFVEIVEPEVAFFVKYEFWFNYIHHLHRKEIPQYFVSAIFRKSQHFFKFYGAWFRRQLRKPTWFFVQNETSENLLKGIGITNVTICGDTRFDRVWSVAQNRRSFPEVAQFIKGKKVLLAGSTWPPDEDLLERLLNRHPGEFKVIVAPHEIHPDRMDALSSRLKVPTVKYSQLSELKNSEADLLFIDNIGMLLHLYQYADVAYIGGGFGKCIHNILEAATFGKPVVFGPKYHKFQEAKDLIALGGAVSVNRFEEYEATILHLLSDPTSWGRASTACSEYVAGNRGGTEIILERAFYEV